MNHHHRKTLHALFAHPVSSNIDMKDVVHVVESLGGTVETKHGNRYGFALNGHQHAFTHAQHALPKEEVMQIKKFLTQCGIDPEKYPV